MVPCFFTIPRPFSGCVLLNLWSPKCGCCLISDVLSCSFNTRCTFFCLVHRFKCRKYRQYGDKNRIKTIFRVAFSGGIIAHSLQVCVIYSIFLSIRARDANVLSQERGGVQNSKTLTWGEWTILRKECEEMWPETLLFLYSCLIILYTRHSGNGTLQ